MAKVIVHHEEGLDRALKRFKRYVDKDGIIDDHKKHTAFRSKSEERRSKRRKK